MEIGLVRRYGLVVSCLPLCKCSPSQSLPPDGRLTPGSILQLFLAFLSWFQYRRERREFHKKCSCGNGEDYDVQTAEPTFQKMKMEVLRTDVIIDRKSFGSVTTSSDMDPEEKDKESI